MIMIMIRRRISKTTTTRTTTTRATLQVYLLTHDVPVLPVAGPDPVHQVHQLLALTVQHLGLVKDILSIGYSFQTRLSPETGFLWV